MRPAKRINKEARIKKSLINLFAKDRFNTIKSDFSNLKQVYESNFKVWLLNNSDDTYTLNGESVVIKNGVMENADNVVSNGAREGFALEASDFIEAELEFLDSLDETSYDVIEKKQLKAYKQILHKQLKKPSVPKQSFVESFYDIKDYHKVVELLERYNIAREHEGKYMWIASSENRTTLLTAFYDTLVKNGLIKKHQTLQEATDAINGHFYYDYHKGYFKRHRAYKHYESMLTDFHFIPKRVK